MKLEKYLWNHLIKKGEKKEQHDVCPCGSCRYYDFTYDSACDGKQLWIESTYATVLNYTKPIPFIKSPKRNYYRSRMDFVATKGLIGLRRPGGFNNVYDVDESCIFDEDIGEMLDVFRKFKEFPDYNLITHEGIIRYFVIRKTEHNNEKLWHVSIVLSSIPDDFAEKLTSFLTDYQTLDMLTTLVLVTQPSLADISYGEVAKYLKGSELTQDVRVDGKTFVFTYGPQSFFQANVSVFEIVLKDMREWASKLDAVETVYDLYGGVGSIGVALAEYGNKLVSVDISKENTDYFMKNAQQNGVALAEVVNGTVESYLDANELTENSIAIIDPPRVGMEPKIVEKFLAQKNLPKAIIYMSCNPNSQAADIKLLEGKYELESVIAYDMFPHATHLEAVAFLKRR